MSYELRRARQWRGLWIVGMAVGVGLLTWVIDAALEAAFFFDESFAALLYSAVPEHELFMRGVAVLSSTTFGVVVWAVYRRWRRAQDAAERERRRLFAVLEELPALVFLVDAEYQLRFANRCVRELFGLSEQPCFTIIAGLDHPCEACPLRQFIAGKPAQDAEWNPRGDRVYQLHRRALALETGVPAMLVFGFDITERKRAAEALETTDRAKMQFLARMSHEIRTPMNGLLGATVLALETDPSAEQREYLSMVKVSSEALMTVINDILEYAKLESETLVLQAVQFDAVALVKETAQGFRTLGRQQSTTVRTEVSSSVPPRVVGDPLRVRQVLVNLLDNALKFSGPNGEVTLSLELDALNALHLSVADTGIGIPAEKHAEIFASFVQVNDGSTARAGTGLGLPIAARLVELMGGRIWVDSVVGEGSTFHVTLPLVTQRSAGVPVAEAPPQLRVLVAEDHPVSREYVVRLLEREGHSVVAVGSGAAALAAIDGERFDLALLDIQMPEHDGLETTVRIRRRGDDRARLPIIGITAGPLDDRQRCLAAGMNGFISKPYRPTELLATIGEALTDAPGSGVPGADPQSSQPRVDELAALLDDDLKRMSDALTRGNAAELQRLAHGMAGAAGILQRPAVVAIARRVEAAAREGQLAEASSVMAELRRELSRSQDVAALPR